MDYYQLCCQHKGKLAQITEKSGRVHVGKIADVDQKYVYIEPAARRRGFGYGYPPHGYGHHSYGHYSYGKHGYGHHGYGGPYGHRPGFGGGYGPGFAGNPHWVPVALAGVGGFALGSAFFW
ncbi:hypothetical protein MM300_02440 [Evansella sp. LMS18]|uniref:hypothetical protein n=1 Tax=Evansella sp. LMS18 TaxID=2924033 RepID=UPI0020D0BFE1|nr:hypothetical protein [Evansella sp. LMS18]UTR11211.1 hypothetical protein MM300_02440 [Evansella sp. LMS18]